MGFEGWWGQRTRKSSRTNADISKASQGMGAF
jgi:hypothetical protein